MANPLPATVTIFDLATTSNVSTSAVFEAQFTSGGVATTVQLSLSQMASTILSSFLNGTGGWPIVANGTTSAPSVQQLSLATTGVTGTLPVTRGGVGTNTLTAFGVVWGAGTSTVGITSAGTTGWPLIGNGTLAAPSFQQINLTAAALTGVLGIPFGGTGQTTARLAFDALSPTTIRGDIIYRNATTNIQLAAGTTGYALKTNGTSADPAWYPARDVFTSNRNYFVGPAGSNSNSGTSSGAAWQTLQYAQDFIVANVDLAGFQAVVNIAAGTYTAGITTYGPQPVGAPSAGSGIVYVGDTTTPSNVIISVSSGDQTIHATYDGFIDIRGVEIRNSVTDGVYASGGGKVTISGKVAFGTCAGYHMHSNVNGSIVVSASSYNISGGAQAHYFADKVSTIELTTTSVTISNAPNFALAFALASDGFLIHAGCTFTNGGTVTGNRYIVLLNGVMNTGGGGELYFPGNGAGQIIQGGQYDGASQPILIGGVLTTSTLTLKPTSAVGATTSDIVFQVGNNGATEAMRIVKAGQVGIGVTPATTWGTTYKVAQFSNGAIGGSTTAIVMFQNVVFDDTNFRSVATGSSALHIMSNGNFQWYTAPSVTAGGTATVTEKLRVANSTGVAILPGLALATVGTAALLFGSLAGFGIYIGTGVPSVAAGTGSLFLRNDGVSATTRMYVNADGNTTWTGVTTVA